MFLTFLFYSGTAQRVTLSPRQEITLTFEEGGVFACYNPENFYGFVYKKSKPNEGCSILEYTGIWIVEFTEAGKLKIQNLGFVSKDLFYITSTLKSSSCDVYEFISDPSVGHYFIDSANLKVNGRKYNLTMSSYTNVCLFYVGPAKYHLRVMNNCNQYETSLLIDGKNYKDDYISVDTGFTLQYNTKQPTESSGYAFVEITDVIRYDSSTGYEKRANNDNILKVSGDEFTRGGIKTIRDLEDRVDTGLKYFISSIYLYFYFFIASIGGVFIIFLIVFCFCNYIECSYFRAKNQDSLLSVSTIVGQNS